MFELAKKEFLNENGTLNGDTTKRESVYNNLYRKMDKDDRLSAGWTMEQYEHQYRQAFAEAAKAADPTWKAGKPIPAGVENWSMQSRKSRLLKKLQMADAGSPRRMGIKAPAGNGSRTPCEATEAGRQYAQRGCWMYNCRGDTQAFTMPGLTLLLPIRAVRMLTQ